jgi:hypothetical protein
VGLKLAIFLPHSLQLLDYQSVVAHAYHPSNVGGVKKRMTTVQAGLGKNVRPYLKNN